MKDLGCILKMRSEETSIPCLFLFYIIFLPCTMHAKLIGACGYVNSWIVLKLYMCVRVCVCVGGGAQDVRNWWDIYSVDAIPIHISFSPISHVQIFDFTRLWKFSCFCCFLCFVYLCVYVCVCVCVCMCVILSLKCASSKCNKLHGENHFVR